MKIVTFNTRVDAPEDGINNIKFRMPFIKAKFEAMKPEIIGFQELKSHTFNEFKTEFPDYYILGFGRDADYDGESIPIGFRKDCFNLLEMGGAWLSDTPNVPASRLEGQSGIPRTIMWVKLLDLKTKKIFRVYNTHLDHPDVEDYAPRRMEIKKVIEMIDADMAKEQLPFILMGDFNAFPHTWETEELDERKDFIDFTENVGATYHNWGNPERMKKIDYIIGSKDWKVSNVEKWTECHDGVWLSDHYPVCLTAEL